MKLRLDLLKELTEEDILEEAMSQQHRYQADPTFCNNGMGYLSPASEEDAAKELERIESLGRKLTQRAMVSQAED